MMVDLWEMRNEDVHGKEEVTKQQKRKAKVAISVRALHLFFFWRNPFTKYTRKSRPICKNQNVHHGGPERPPVTNPSGKLTNINIT